MKKLSGNINYFCIIIILFNFYTINAFADKDTLDCQYGEYKRDTSTQKKYEVGFGYDSSTINPENSSSVSDNYGLFNLTGRYVKSILNPKHRRACIGEDLPEVLFGDPTMVVEGSLDLSEENLSQPSDIRDIDFGFRIPLMKLKPFNPEIPPAHSLGLIFAYTDFNLEEISQTQSNNDQWKYDIEYMYSTLPQPRKGDIFNRSEFRTAVGYTSVFDTDNRLLESDGIYLDARFTLNGNRVLAVLKKDEDGNIVVDKEGKPDLQERTSIEYEFGPRLYYHNLNYENSSGNDESYISGQLRGQIVYDIGEEGGWKLFADLSLGYEDIRSLRGQEIDYSDSFVRGGITFTYLINKGDFGSSWGGGGRYRRP